MVTKTSFTQRQLKIPVQVILFLFLAAGLITISPAQDFGVPSRTTTGAGVRSFGMGNNYVAVAEDGSAMFWNPAGLAFCPVREFQFAFNGFANRATTEYSYGAINNETSSNHIRIRPMYIGLLRAIPTSQGGFSLAFGFQNPYLMDDQFKYLSGTAQDEYYAYGHMNLWTAAFGMQVAPNFAIGASVSLLSGRNNMRLNTTYLIPTIDNIDEEDNKLTQAYLGVDFRGGLLYRVHDNMKIGLRMVIPQYIWFDEKYTYEAIVKDSIIDHGEWLNHGQLRSSPSGAVGISYRFPFMLLSSEVQARAPIPEADDGSYYSYWKIGAGGGAEIPMFGKSVCLRMGYSWQEFDRNPLLIEYNGGGPDEDPTLFNTDINVTVLRDEHCITSGLSFLAQQGISFDIAYGFKFWKFSSYLANGAERVENHQTHYIMASFAIRY